ncbi:MAG: hypothetical protein CFE43_03660 [Burkholderiales bacterium PBB3]|nr:MAG: hypothetical protein CFE43_03660 [Burkholderiales bacterium PBB3]
MKLKSTMAGVAVTLLATALGPTWAAGPNPSPGWRGDIRQFESQDAYRWRAGNWHHGPHAGRSGWWWVAGGIWYLYPRPVYPYPDPYRPPVVVVEQSVPVVIQAAPSAPPPPPTPAVWYFCEAANGYYPYVPACPTGWKTVPATPAPATPMTPTTP